MKFKRTFAVSKIGLLSLCIAASMAQAQDNQNGDSLEEVVVTGYRGGLATSTAAKRDSNGFSDVIFADDIGKMPSQNLAESLNRIPGVKISREITGEGQQISVRGLGPSFTKIVLNGNDMSIASTGSLDSGNRGREVDLDMFPTELFGSLSVSKTAMAHQQEGSVSGYVNMKTLRPFDLEEGHTTKFSLDGSYGELSKKTSPRYSFVYSFSDEKFGILVGLAGAQNTTRVDGYEAVALYTDGCVSEETNVDETPGVFDSSGCIEGSQGLNHFRWSPTAREGYAAATPGVEVGDVLDYPAITGVSAEALDVALVPYLGRPMTVVGDRDRVTGLISAQYRPNSDIEITLDVMHGKASRNFIRSEAMWWGRRNHEHQGAAMIPTDITIGQRGENSYITSGTFYDVNLWAASRDYQEDLTFTSVMPSLSWQFTDTFKMELSASSTSSDFDRDEPYALYISPSGTLNYTMGSSGVPSFQFSHDISDPGIDWTWNKEFDQDGDGIIQEDEKFSDKFRFQRNSRNTDTEGFHADFALGENAEVSGIKFGLAWDKMSSTIRSFGGSGPFNDDHVLPSDVYANFNNYLTDSVVSDLGDNIDGYNGYTGIAQIDWPRFKDATNYSAFDPTESGGDQFGQSNGEISEEMLAIYIESNLEADVLDRPLRMNMGVRYVDTEQHLDSLDSSSVTTDYTKVLPSMSAVYDATDNLKLRMSASKSLTRANPARMYPSSSWSSSGIDTVRAGNSGLSPFESINFDIGGEYYFSDGISYVGLTYFEKEITGFTETNTLTVPFSDLPIDWGLSIDSADLGPDREQALIACGGPATCTTNVDTRTNVDGIATLTGFELVYVQDLSFVVEGLGFNASATTIDQEATDEGAIITGISDWTYSFTAYYESGPFQTHLSFFHQDGSKAGEGQGIDRLSFDRSQVDLSASYELPFMEDYNLSLTFDGYNLTNEPLGTWHGTEGTPYTAFYPGATYTFGVRGSF